MDTDPSIDPKSVHGSDALDTRYRPSGFWRRLFAYLVDTVLVGILGLMLGYSLYEFFQSIGQGGRLIGLSIYLAYFGLLNSNLGGGQTLGKRMMGIKVVDTDGATLAVPRSIARQLIIALPIFLNGLSFNAVLHTPFVSAILGAAVFGIGGLAVYMLIFNRRTRRCPHDYICKTIVVIDESNRESPDPGSFWIGHYAILGVIIVAAIAAMIPIRNWFLKSFDFDQLLAIQENLLEQENIQAAGVRISRHTNYRNGEAISRNVLIITAFSPGNVESVEGYSLDIIGTLFEDRSSLPDPDVIAISVVQGFDIGIAKSTTSRTISESLIGWERVYRSYKESGVAPKANISTNTNIRF